MGPCLQVHFAVAPLAHLFGVVADVVAAVLAAAEADTLLEAIWASALEGKAHVVPVHQGVHEQVHCSLVFTLHYFHEVWKDVGTNRSSCGKIQFFSPRFQARVSARLNTHFLPLPARP